MEVTKGKTKKMLVRKGTNGSEESESRKAGDKKKK